MSMERRVRRTTRNTTLELHDGVVLADATSAPITVTLPHAGYAALNSLEFVVKRLNAGVNAVTVVPKIAAQTIDGAANRALAAQYNAVRLVPEPRLAANGGTGASPTGYVWHVVGSA
jgi:hypothetical protein